MRKEVCNLLSRPLITLAETVDKDGIIPRRHRALQNNFRRRVAVSRVEELKQQETNRHDDGHGLKLIRRRLVRVRHLWRAALRVLRVGQNVAQRTRIMRRTRVRRVERRPARVFTRHRTIVKALRLPDRTPSSLTETQNGILDGIRAFARHVCRRARPRHRSRHRVRRRERVIRHILRQ